MNLRAVKSDCNSDRRERLLESYCRAWKSSTDEEKGETVQERLDQNDWYFARYRPNRNHSRFW